MTRNENQSVGTPYKTILEAAAVSGLSQSYLRKGCKDGTVPHICVGTKYMINVPALFDQLGVPYEPVRM